MRGKLDKIAEEYNTNILFACESGSRAWGFPSPDSDFDVRFVYTHPLEWYLTLKENQDSITIMNGDFDAVGWELRKKLRLLKKSNIPALEHLFSPILYKHENESLNELRAIAKECFSPIASMHHYLSMSKKYEEKLSHSSIKLKDVFYALRTSLAGKWILEYNSMPPVIFNEMLSLTKKEIASEIELLIDIKSTKKETYLHPRNELLIQFISKTIQINHKYAQSLSAGKPNDDRLNNFLYKEITK